MTQRRKPKQPILLFFHLFLALLPGSLTNRLAGPSSPFQLQGTLLQVSQPCIHPLSLLLLASSTPSRRPISAERFHSFRSMSSVCLPFLPPSVTGWGPGLLAAQHRSILWAHTGLPFCTPGTSFPLHFNLCSWLPPGPFHQLWALNNKLRPSSLNSQGSPCSKVSCNWFWLLLSSKVKLSSPQGLASNM